MALTFFTAAKPFEGHIDTIQRRAIRSWQRAGARCEVIVCGDEPGTRDVVAKLGLRHLPNVARSEFGTPLLSSVFELAEVQAEYDTLCYLNADLVLFPDFLEAVERVRTAADDFLAVGQTTNLVLDQDLPDDVLRERALTSGALRGREWIDFFVFRRAKLGRLPDFAVGRPYWDNWMIWRARSLHWNVVDITPSTLVVHQKHGYEHVPHASGRRWEGPEADRNRALLSVPERAFDLDECTHRLTPAGLVQNHPGLFHRIGTGLLLKPRTATAYRLLRGAYGGARRALRR